MSRVPDALTDHHVLVTSLGNEEEVSDAADEEQLKAEVILTEETDGDEPMVQGVAFLSEDANASGHLLQLQDGSTVFVPSINCAQTITLEDGSTAYVQEDDKDGQASLQMVELDDGSTAYIALVNGPDSEDNSMAKPDDEEEQESKDYDDDLDTGNDRQSNKERFFPCLFAGCGKSYTTLHHLKVHERKHTGVRPFTCLADGCFKAFATSYSLKSHMRVHTGEKPYACTEEKCDKSFKTSGDLQKHVRTHTGERPFRCTYEGCFRSFTTSNIRKVHMRVHTGERPYVCPEANCMRSFASATNYKNHVRIHTGEKPYVCTVMGCSKRFTEYSSLYKHQIVHSQQKPYYCNVCSRNYRQAYTLTMHKRTAHGIIESEDGTEIVLDEELAAELFANTTKRKRTSVTVEPTESGMDEVCVQLVESSEGITVSSQTTTLVAMQGASARTIQKVAKAAASCNSSAQIFLVADSSHLAALQQMGVTAGLLTEEKDDESSS